MTGAELLSGLLSEYGLPVGIATAGFFALLASLSLLARRGIAPGLWRGIVRHKGRTSLLFLLMLALVGLLTLLGNMVRTTQIREREARDFETPSNLLYNKPFARIALTDALPSSGGDGPVIFSAYTDTHPVGSQSALSSSAIKVRPGNTYRYSFYTDIPDDGPYGDIHARILWLDPALTVITHTDTVTWWVEGDVWRYNAPEFRTDTYRAPPGSAYLKFEIRNVSPYYRGNSNSVITVWGLKLSQDGVYIEQHPNGAQGSIAFSFDWESAMGGLIHSKGVSLHDPAAAIQRGLEMREGADWLNSLFDKHNIKASFYATGYNLLDGNKEKRQFSGNPTYSWASPKYNWDSSHWLTHPWYSDDPYGDFETHPAWYFGDQTRTLLAAGHEIAPHTFGHLYVRGSTPDELGTDMDEWLAAAKAVGVPPPTTFAFPWRSSNSVTADFYDVLYKRGIRAVTRLYEKDMRDLYTVGAVPAYPQIAVMPDFLLETASAPGGEREETTQGTLGLEEGMKVISETLARRGTTSFWTHPEQLANSPSLADVRQTWEGVVAAAARERDNGRLHIATVADIVAYQRDVTSVTASLDKEFLGDWKLRVSNESGKELSGVTLTLPADASYLASPDTEVLTVKWDNPKSKIQNLKSSYPARQLVLSKLKPGVTTVSVRWADGWEPER